MNSQSALILASASPRRSELLRNARIPFIVHPAHINEELHPQENPLDYVQRLAHEKARAVFAQRASKWDSNPESEVILAADTIVVVDSQILGKPKDAADSARMLRLLSGRSHKVITGVCLLSCLASNQHSAISGTGTQHSTFGIQPKEMIVIPSERSESRDIGFGKQHPQTLNQEQKTRNQQPETRNSKLETVFEDVRAETTEVFMNPLSEDAIQTYVASGEPMDKAGAYAIQGIASRWIPKIVGCYFNVVGMPVPLVYRMLQEAASALAQNDTRKFRRL